MTANEGQGLAASEPVAVIGGGTIGAGWSALFALSGLAVRVVDPSPSAPEAVQAMLERARPVLAALGRLSPAATVPQVTADLHEGIAGVCHIQEVLPENLALKRQVYRQIEQTAPDTALIASSSSGLLPTQLQQAMRVPGRLLVAHPCNPPYLMPLVELVAGLQTTPQTIADATAFYQGLGKKTVVLRKEVTGHLANRLQAALWREAVYLVAEGYASVEDVDLAITEGLGARWAVCGPHEIFHLSGGAQGMAGFLDRLGPAITDWWASLGAPVLDTATRDKLVQGMAEAARGQSQPAMSEARDRNLLAIMAAKARLA